MTGAVRRIHLTVFCAISRAMFCRRSAAVCSFYIFNCKDYIVQNEAHILFSKHTYTYLVVTYHGSKHIFTISLYSVNFHILFFLRFPDWTETFMQHGWNKKKKKIVSQLISPSVCAHLLCSVYYSENHAAARGTCRSSDWTTSADLHLTGG